MNNTDSKREGWAIAVRKKYAEFTGNRSVEDANIGRYFFTTLWDAIQQDYRESGRCYYVEEVAKGRYEWIKMAELSLLCAMRISDHRPDLSEANLPYLCYSWYKSMDNTKGTTSDVLEQAKVLNDRKQGMRLSGTGKNSCEDYTIVAGKGSGQYRHIGSLHQQYQYDRTDRGDSALSQNDTKLNNWAVTLGMDDSSGLSYPPARFSTHSNAQSSGITPSQTQAVSVPSAPQPRPDQQPSVSQQAQSLQQPPHDTEQQTREQGLHIQQLEELMRLERLAWDAQVADQPDQTLTQQLEQTRGDMVTTINDLKRNWSQMLEEHFTQLQKLQEQTTAESIRRMQAQQHELTGNLRKWQRSLYIANFKELANCYAQLYRIVIRQERQCAELEAQGELRTTDKELKESLTIFRRVFEKALESLNLFIFVPKAGDHYDDVIHIMEQPSDAEQPLTGATVAECVIPGILHRPENAEDAEDYDVICRATVRLNI